MKGFNIRWRSRLIARIDRESALGAVIVAAVIYSAGIPLGWW